MFYFLVHTLLIAACTFRIGWRFHAASSTCHICPNNHSCKIAFDLSIFFSYDKLLWFKKINSCAVSVRFFVPSQSYQTPNNSAAVLRKLLQQMFCHSAHMDTESRGSAFAPSARARTLIIQKEHPAASNHTLSWGTKDKPCTNKWASRGAGWGCKAGVNGGTW